MASLITNSNSLTSNSSTNSNGLGTPSNYYHQTTSTNNVILVAKFDYKAKEPNELDLKKSERLFLIDNSKIWWLVRKIDTDQTGYVPSNYVKKEKKSLLEKIIPRKLHQIGNSHNLNLNLNTEANNSNKQTVLCSPVAQPINSIIRAIVKHKYIANKSDELTLNVGVRVIVLEKFGDGWWKIAVEDSNNSNSIQSVGLYPSNYLQEDSKSNIKNSDSSDSKQLQLQNEHASPRTNSDNSNPNLDSSYPKCESISSNEKEIEYLRVIYPYKSSNTNNVKTNSFNSELSVCLNEIVKLVEDDPECYDCDKSWIKVFNSQGITGMIPSKCVEPILDNQLQDFVFIRRPTTLGLLAYNPWYFGNITRFETILLLNKYATNGDYLVRDSDNGDYSISLKSDSINNKHFKVFYKDGKFLIGKKVFNTMPELLEHYHRNPIYDQNGEKLYLVKSFEPPSFDSILLK